jgi:small-conductance mechanosensitive channel
MNDFFTIDLSLISIFSLLGMGVLGVVIYFLTWFIQQYGLILLVKSPVKRKRVSTLLPAVFTIGWIVFGLYCFYTLIVPFPFMGIILSAVFIYLGKGYFVNLIHGLFFRLKGDISIGQKIAMKNYAGEVVELNTFDVAIQNEEGEIIQIPYGNMASMEIVKRDFSADFSSHKFVITTSSSITESTLKNSLLSQPWVSSVIIPKITRLKEEDETITYSVLAYPIDEKYNSFVERDLRLASRAR